MSLEGTVQLKLVL